MPNESPSSDAFWCSSVVPQTFSRGAPTVTMTSSKGSGFDGCRESGLEAGTDTALADERRDEAGEAAEGTGFRRRELRAEPGQAPLSGLGRGTPGGGKGCPRPMGCEAEVEENSADFSALFEFDPFWRCNSPMLQFRAAEVAEVIVELTVFALSAVDGFGIARGALRWRVSSSGIASED